MKNLIISYDLRKPGQNYEAVAKAIKSLGAWARLHGSVWYVRSSKSAVEARDVIARALDGNDSVFVVDASTNEAAWNGLSDEVSKFVKDHWYSSPATLHL